MFYFEGTRKPNFKNISGNIYDDYWEERGARMNAKLLERERIFFDWINEGVNVLSIGCGNSRILYELENIKNCKTCGIDIASAVVNELKKNGISAYNEDVTREKFELGRLFSKKFDFIILSEILEHIPVPENLIKKIANWTKFIIISAPNSAFYRYRLGLLMNGRFFTQWTKHPAEHLRYWSHLDFLDWIAARDLELIQATASNGPKYLKDYFPNMFGHQICYLARTGVERSP